jgi:flavin reductase (DIM6/NTAB) family NADH-FMN oxidoreductase RutF
MSMIEHPSPHRNGSPPSLATAEELKRGMRKLAGGVNVITVRDGGQAHGMTATAVCSLSADPPQLLVCVNSTASPHGPIMRAGAFGVNVLGHDQEDIARRFAGMDGCERAQRFSIGRWTTHTTGAPLLEDALSAFDCQVVQEISAPTHTIFIGRVVAVMTKSGGAPLIFHESRFTGIEPK